MGPDPQCCIRWWCYLCLFVGAASECTADGLAFEKSSMNRFAAKCIMGLSKVLQCHKARRAAPNDRNSHS